MGALNDGIKEIGPNLRQFFSANSEKIDNIPPLPKQQEHSISENFDDISIDLPKAEDDNVEEIYIEEDTEETEPEKLEEEPIIEKKAEKREIIEKEDISERKESFFDKIMNYNNNTTKNIEAAINPYDYPAIFGAAKVISGDTLLIRNHVIRLYGIDAPSKQQSCADARGHAYACGKQAARWLQNWILDNEIECHVLKQDKNNNMLATCAYGQYDLGAALVMVGWAVPLPNVDVYAPYEQEAQKNHSGMWQGKFYKPWDWEKIQAQKPKIKIIKKENKKRLWDYL
jgi:endonuclease YncB( thermonuclease family)